MSLLFFRAGRLGAFAAIGTMAGCASDSLVSDQRSSPTMSEMRSTSNYASRPEKPTSSQPNGVVQASAAIPAESPHPSVQPESVSEPLKLSLDSAIGYTLTNNPQLASLRMQHGVAAAGVVIAKTYPFNPIYQGNVRYAQGSPGTVSNPAFNSHQVTLEVQLFHQERYRQQAAFAALTRTDWEIASQELTFSVNAIRAFDALLYRKGKLEVTEEFLRLNRKSVEQVKQLVDSGTLKSSDLILARAEVNDIETQVNLNRTAVISARKDFYRALGVGCGIAEPIGTLERAAPAGKVDEWLCAAFELRPDRFARLAAVSEADANIRLQKADRFGNPQIGPAYEYNESQTNFFGAVIQFPIPVLNRRPGEIRQAEAHRAQAVASVNQTEVEIRQDVSLAAARLVEAKHWVDNYRGKILPELEKSLEDMESLFKQGQAGVDILRVLDVRRKLLHARDGYMDALIAYTQALADLAEAVGDPCLALGVDNRAIQTPPNTAPPK